MVRVVGHEAEREQRTVRHVSEQFQLGAPVAADFARDAPGTEVRGRFGEVVAGVVRLEDQVGGLVGEGRDESVADVDFGGGGVGFAPPDAAVRAVARVPGLEERAVGSCGFGVGGGEIRRRFHDLEVVVGAAVGGKGRLGGWNLLGYGDLLTAAHSPGRAPQSPALSGSRAGQ